MADGGYSHIRLNPAAAAMFNVPTDFNFASPARFLQWKSYRDGRSMSADDMPLRRAVEGGAIIRAEEMEIVFVDGRRMNLLLSATPFRDRENRIVGAVAAFTDITTLKDLQRDLETRRREAEEASVRKTRFLAAVSHDIRTPANAINLLAELIRRTASNPAFVAEIPEMAGELQSSASTLVELVSDVLDVARFDSGKVDLQESEFALQEVLSDEVRHLQPLADQKQIALELVPLDGTVWMRADRIKLGRVLGNLVGNAIKFTSSGSVRLSGRCDDNGTVEMDVIDTGIGIATEHLPHIFDEFYQLRNPERDRNKGTGLGLAISKRLMDAMGGTISVQSVPGEGSRFTVTLPASCIASRNETTASPPARLETDTVGSRPLEGHRILLVEDHNATRNAASQLLGRLGATVVQAGTGQEGLAALTLQTPEILLLDLMLPDMDGREVLRSIQANRPAALKAVVVLTGDLMSNRLDEIKSLGADLFVSKPIDLARVVQLIREVIDRAAPAS